MKELLIKELQFFEEEKKKCVHNSDRYKFIQAIINHILTQLSK